MATPYRPIGGIGRGVPIRSDAVIALGGTTNNVSDFGAGNDSSNVGSNQRGFGGGNQSSGLVSYDFGSSNAGGSGSDRGNDPQIKHVWPKGKNRGLGGGHKANYASNFGSGNQNFGSNQGGFGGSNQTSGFGSNDFGSSGGGGFGSSQGNAPGDGGCRKCGQSGHFARECPNGQSGFGGDSGYVGGFGGGGSGRGGPQTCRKCNQEGHIARDCPIGDASGGGFGGGSRGFGGGVGDRGRSRGCFNCGEEGHMSTDCMQPRKPCNEGGRSCRGFNSGSGGFSSGEGFSGGNDNAVGGFGGSGFGGGGEGGEVSHSSLYPPGTAIHFMIDALNSTCGGGFSVEQLKSNTTLSPHHIHELNKKFKGLTVFVQVKPFVGEPYEREYRVNRITEMNAIRMTFPENSHDGVRTVSVAAYYKDRYGELKFPNLQLLCVGLGRRDAYFPIERCNVKPGLGDMTKATATTAPKVNAQMNQIEAQPPKTEYAEKEFSNVDTSKGALEQRQQKYYLAAGSQRIGAIIIDDNRDTTMYREFFGFLLETCRDFGMQVPTMIQDRVIRRIPVACAAADLELCLQEFEEMGADLVIVALPQEDSPLYSEVSRIAEVMRNYGVMTKCVTKSTIQETLQKQDRRTTGNLASEMNMKLGGINSKGEAEAQAKKILEDKSTLILGIDAKYPGQLKKNASPIATVVGNTDSSFLRYEASVSVREYLSVHLTGQVRERLYKYYQGEDQLNGERKKAGLPLLQPKVQRIIIYRDGVAKGEFLQDILKDELVSVREACETLGGPGYWPSITFIVAQKQQEACGRGDNIWSGTVVDKAITHPSRMSYDAATSSRPVRYHVLTDDKEFTADNMQNLTFYLTHCFGLSTEHVSLPVPLYFADLACRRARIYLQDKESVFSSDTSSQSGTKPGDAVPAISDEELIKGSAVTPSLKMKMVIE